MFTPGPILVTGLCYWSWYETEPCTTHHTTRGRGGTYSETYPYIFFRSSQKLLPDVVWLLKISWRCTACYGSFWPIRRRGVRVGTSFKNGVSRVNRPERARIVASRPRTARLWLVNSSQVEMGVYKIGIQKSSTNSK